MIPRRFHARAVSALALMALVMASCTTPPTATSPQPLPTDTVVYTVPNAPINPTAEQPATAGPTGTAVPETRGPLPRAQLTILHTNDSRGYVDPCG